jgi:hypothetical protein
MNVAAVTGFVTDASGNNVSLVMGTPGLASPA